MNGGFKVRRNILILGIVLIILIGIIVLFTTYKKTRSQNLNIQKDSKSAQELYIEADTFLKNADFLAARDTYQKIMNDFPSFKQIQDVQSKLEELNMKIIFSNMMTPKTQMYEVNPGDSLDKIAKKFNTTVELLKKSNNLGSNVIQAGRKLRVWIGKFSILVDKSQNILILKSDGEIVKVYKASTGANNSTPVGTFKIVNKLANPVWFKSGKVIPPESPENILGVRWLGFDNPGYGIHGTVDPATIGQQITQGCVRISNKDIEELYAILPIGTEVTIID